MVERIFDTDHLSLLERGHPTLKIRFAAVSPDSLAVSIITVEEMLRGCLAVLARRAEGERRVHAYQKLMEPCYSSALFRPFPLI